MPEQVRGEPVRQLRIPASLATELEQQFPQESLSEAAKRAITAYLAGPPRAPGHVIRPSGEKVRGKQCTHPQGARVGTRCTLCGSRVHRPGEPL